MYKAFLKRFFDIVISLITLPFVLLVIIILAPFIYLEDRGPVFYNAPRRGKDGKEFKMFKLRSMYVNSPNLRNADGSTFNSAKDPRVTKIGRLMRKTSLDEVPQFLNVLLGHMSLIGPRPNMPTTPYDQLPELSKKRLQVRPGITGYVQAYYRNSIGQEEKVRLDCYYMEHVSFALDVKILFQTVKSVLKRENIYVSAEEKPAERKEPEEGQNQTEEKKEV